MGGRPSGRPCPRSKTGVTDMYLREVSLRRDLVQDWDAYPYNIPAIRHLDQLPFRRNVVFFVGENGSGKSTLLEAIAYQCGFSTAGGGRSNLLRVESADSALGEAIRLSWLPKITEGFFLRAETFYHFASYLDELARDPLSGGRSVYNAYGGRSLHERSHGEAFLALFTHRFGRRGLYLLDEPEAALSPARQLAFLRLIHDLGPTAQWVIATHSPILLGYPGAQIFSFDAAPPEEIAYEETEHYRITRHFLERRERMLAELFRPDDD